MGFSPLGTKSTVEKVRVLAQPVQTKTDTAIDNCQIRFIFIIASRSFSFALLRSLRSRERVAFGERDRYWLSSCHNTGQFRLASPFHSFCARYRMRCMAISAKPLPLPNSNLRH